MRLDGEFAGAMEVEEVRAHSGPFCPPIEVTSAGSGVPQLVSALAHTLVASQTAGPGGTVGEQEVDLAPLVHLLSDHMGGPNGSYGASHSSYATSMGGNGIRAVSSSTGGGLLSSMDLAVMGHTLATVKARLEDRLQARLNSGD